jgi:uncharacterized protein involved in exopolysaccharide biosynthesis
MSWAQENEIETINMKGPEVKTTPGLSDLEAPISVGPENGGFLAGEPTARQDFGERVAQHETAASLRLLWENRGFLGRVAGAGLVLSALIALLIPSRYQSVTRLMPPDNQSGSGLAMAAAALSGGAGGLGGIASDMLGLKSSSDLLVGILGSRTVEDKLIQEFDLRKVYRDRRMEDARKDLAAHTDISVDKKSQIITIGVTDHSPQLAAAMAQAYVEELNRTVAEVSTSSARRERIFLEGRLQAVNQDLEAAEKEFSQFSSKNTAIDIKEQGKAMVEAAATLQGQLIAARSELEGLRQLYADSNVRVRSVQARVAELENQLRIVDGNDDKSVLEKGVPGDALYPSIRKLPLLGVPYADLFRKTKVEEAVFETLTREYELAKVEEAKEIPTVKVLDPPNVPERKTFPRRTLITLLGGALAFACGVIWLFGCLMWERTDPADPGKVLAKEVFDTMKATMPWASRNGSWLRHSSGKTGSHRDPSGLEKKAGK